MFPVVIYSLACVGVFTLAGGAYLGLGWAYGHNRGHILVWDDLSGHAVGVGFGMWQVSYIRPDGNKREVRIPTQALTGGLVALRAKEREDVFEPGRVRGNPSTRVRLFS